MKEKQQRRYKRHKRIRTEIKGVKEKPRLCVFKSLNHIYAQIINDDSGKTIVSASDRELKLKVKTNKTAAALEVGKLIAKKSQEKKIEEVVFDRGGYKYHGRVKSLADGAREGGLKF